MTDKKSPPSGKEEVTDVLSSIRRLVSDELRERGASQSGPEPDVLSLDNDIATSETPPLILSDTQSPLTDLRPDPPLTGPRTAPTAPTAPETPRSGPKPEGPRVPMGETRPQAPSPDRPEPRIVIEAAVDRVRPVRADSPGLPKPIRPAAAAPGDPGPVPQEITREKALPDLPPSAEATESAPARPVGARGDAPRPEENADPDKGRRERARPPGLEEKLSPFALASLNKPAPGRPGPQADGGDEAPEKRPGLVNPFARNRIGREAGEAPDQTASVPSAEIQTATESPEDGYDPEFDSFQSAEKAFAELSEAKEALKGQGAFSGVQSVIEAASFSFSGATPKPAAPAAEDRAAPDAGAQGEAPEPPVSEAADQPAPAPFFDEAELRQIVTEIVRDELAGELGEKLSRNIRKIIRREIALAISDEGGPGILGD